MEMNLEKTEMVGIICRVALTFDPELLQIDIESEEFLKVIN